MFLQKIVDFQVADVLNSPCLDDNFYLVKFLKSGKHVPYKTKFVEKCYRGFKLGVILMLATWGHRPINSLAGELTSNKNQHLA